MGRILAALLFAAALVAQNTPPSGGGGGSGTVGSGTAGQFAAYSSTGTAVGGNANLTDVAGSLTYSGAAGVQVTNASGDAGLIGVACNTTLPSIPSGYIGWIGCNSASATSYFYQPAVTAPSATGPMLVSAVSSNVVGVTYGTQTGTGTVYVASVSPALTGTPTAPTQGVCNASTAIADTAYVGIGCTTVKTTGSPFSAGQTNVNFFNASGAPYVIDLPVPIAGLRLCLANNKVGASAISFVPTTGVTLYYKGVAGTAGSATGLKSSGAVGDYLCLDATDTTTWQAEGAGFGTWTNN